MAPTLDNPDLLFTLVITPDVYLHQIDVADQDTAIVTYILLIYIYMLLLNYILI